VKIIQSQIFKDNLSITPITFFSFIFIFFGMNQALNFLRPIFNLYTIYFEINWAEFQILELFDIINFTFAILIILLGFSLLFYKEFTRSLQIFAGILFLIYNLLDPSHFLMFWSLLMIIMGIPPVWMSVIPNNLVGIYLSSWSILSISHLFLQIFGIYIAIRIILNSKPQKAIIEYLFYFCWVIGLSGIILFLQSTIILSITDSWVSISIVFYIFNFGTWISMCFIGISGLIFIINWRKSQIKLQYIKFGQISLIEFGIMQILTSFSDFTMKTYFSLIFNSIIAGMLIIFALKLTKYFQYEKNLEIEEN